jgi:succinate-semialdehyde dehydrogenase/glutarate-semialdehyde dehydrogenase
MPDKEPTYRTLDPSTGELVEEYPVATAAELDRRLDGAARAFRDWRKRPFADRRAVLEKAASLLEAQAYELAQTMALEMGKPLAEGEAEAKKCAWACRHYAENGEAILTPVPAESDGSEAWVRYEPLGPVLAIMPWNFPLWQVFRFAAPALAAGNAGVLKHASSVPRCALAIERILLEAGAPEGVFQSIFLSGEAATAAIADRRIRGVTLTGSTRAGHEVAAAAGRALKPMVMELGGSDPFIVFADADLDQAAKVAAASRCLNAGQSCISAKRFLVEAPAYPRFRDAFVAHLEAKKVGDPRQEGIELGPLARLDLREELARQVAAAVAAGARILCGGKVPQGQGAFYPPTAFEGLDPAAPAAQEELFGPAAALYSFEDEAEALRIANGTPFGLGASLWSGDRERIDRLVPEIECGSVFVGGLVKSDPRLPFGGIKESGFGRELAAEGLREFTNVKTVWIGKP